MDARSFGRRGRESVMDDDLKDRRKMAEAAEGMEQATSSFMSQSQVIEFGEWANANMPTEALGNHANAMAGAITGSIIGAWFDSGADAEMVKEYLARFTDIVWLQYLAAQKSSR